MLPVGQRVYLTFDQDWAPDFATDLVRDVLTQHGLGGTFFATHKSPALDRLRSTPSVELAWHPNFLPNSSHGRSATEVLDTMAAIVPEAVGARAHCLVQGTPTLLAYRERGLRYDAASLRDGVAGLAPFQTWTGLLDVPIWFEDDVHLERGRACTVDALRLDRPGLRVMTFHPVLVALDARSLAPYQRLKAALATRGTPLTEASAEDFAPFVDGDGVGTLLSQVAAWLSAHPEQAGRNLRDLVTSDGLTRAELGG